MNRFEAAQIFGLLSDADQLKIVKMAYNHGIVHLKRNCGENGNWRKRSYAKNHDARWRESSCRR